MSSNNEVPMWKHNMKLKLFGLLKIPMIFFVGAKLEKMDEKSIAVRIPLKRKTKNHLNSMYFGVLAVGADLAAGFLAFHLIGLSKQKVQLVFKSMDAQFLKRVEGDALFVCDEGLEIQELVKSTIASKERVTKFFTVKVLVPSKLGDDPAAIFKMELSLKAK